VKCCLPTRIQFKKETTELAKEGTSVVSARINKLERMVITLEEQNCVLFVSHNMVLTKMDGKICIAITSMSFAQVCYVLSAAKLMNRID
jgi:broad specificity phosphatase PhoE